MNALLLVLALVPTDPPDSSDGWWALEFAPQGALYEDYVADPRRPVFSLTNLDARRSDIAGAGNSRNSVRMGTRFPMARVQTPWFETPFQIDGHVGFLAQFDYDNSNDNLGWDGVFGADLSWIASPRLRLQVGYGHDSSHLGDEYIEDTGATRINYTREEWNAGARFRASDALVVYGEYGYATKLRMGTRQEHGRAQAGFELEGAARIWNERLAPFLAVDLGAFEEDDWDVAINLQTGLVGRPRNESVWRFGLEFYDGRSTIGELYESHERHLAFGIWIDP